MNIDEILEKSRGTDLSESMTFKLSAEMKSQLLDLCQARGLSNGKVIRALLEEFLANVEV